MSDTPMDYIAAAASLRACTDPQKRHAADVIDELFSYAEGLREALQDVSAQASSKAVGGAYWVPAGTMNAVRAALAKNPRDGGFESRSLTEGWCGKAGSNPADQAQGIASCGLDGSRGLAAGKDRQLQSQRECKRTDADYAIEHAGYLATSAKRLLDNINLVHMAQEALDLRPDEAAFVDLNERLESCTDAMSESVSDVRDMIYEFEKRRDRANLHSHRESPSERGV